MAAEDAKLMEGETTESLAEGPQDVPARSWRRKAFLLAVPAAIVLVVGLAARADREQGAEASSLVADDGKTEIEMLANFDSTCGANPCQAPLTTRKGRAPTDECNTKKGKIRQCENYCCWGKCSQYTCDQNQGFCPRTSPPKRYTQFTANHQCCLDTNDPKTCGNADDTAFHKACKSCMSQKAWCNAQAQQIAANTPGCEDPPKLGKCGYTLETSFTMHHTDEAVRVNTVDVSTNAITAFSGGDDRMIYEWNIYTGEKRSNWTGHTGAVLSVAVMNDAAYFCSVSHNEAHINRILIHSGQVVGPILLKKDLGASDFTKCVGLNAYQDVVVGQANGYTQLWRARATSATEKVPVDIRVWETNNLNIDASQFNDEEWPTKPGKLMTKKQYLKKMKAFYHLDEHIRRLRGMPNADADERLGRALETLENASDVPEVLEDAPEDRQLVSSGTSSAAMPSVNRISNLLWGDVPHGFKPPDNWGAVTSIAMDPGATVFMCGYAAGAIRVWRTYNGDKVTVMPKVINAIPNAHVGEVLALVSEPAGNRFWSGGADGQIIHWSILSKKHIGTPVQMAYAGMVTSMAMLPGGVYFFSGHSNGFFYRHWVPGGGKPTCEQDTNGGTVNALATNPGNVLQLIVALDNGDARTYATGAL